jgi:DNA helicase IV
MGIRLPAWNELSKDEQLPILNLPTSENCVVLGPPGSGKTILALHRAARLWKEGRKVLMLTYNRLLSIYLQEALNSLGLEQFSAQTYHAWLRSFFNNKLKASLPTSTTSNFEYNWEAIERRTKEVGKVIDHLIIDETQDFPVELLKLLARMSRNVSVFADPEQAIFLNTQAEDLTGIFGVPNPYTLTKNYRNPLPILKASRCFVTDDVGPFVENAHRKEGPLPVVLQKKNYYAVNQAIKDFALGNRGQTIGVIVSAKAVNATVKGLQDIGGVSVEYYKTMSNIDMDITSPGIKVLSFGVMKGLEFDTVIIPDMDRPYKRGMDERKDMRRIYVAMSRASETLCLMHQGRGVSMAYPDTMTILGNNRALFKWE